jgi:hypothetical protein
MMNRPLGFANRWYPQAAATACGIVLPSETTIRLVVSPLFVATKLEAFADRGNDDFLFSHDLGDLIAVVDDRDSLFTECQASGEGLSSYLCDRFSSLIETLAFLFWDALPGHLSGDVASQACLLDLERKLRALATLQ